jgi:hypothetical protein
MILFDISDDIGLHFEDWLRTDVRSHESSLNSQVQSVNFNANFFHAFLDFI